MEKLFEITKKGGVLSEVKEEKKRARRTKKQIEKDMMNDYLIHQNEMELEKEKDKTFLAQRRVYENINHLSYNEKMAFENKFTKPINYNQEEYVSTLKNKHKKIIVVSGPAGTGKTLFATEFGVKYFMTGSYEKLIFTRPSVSVDEELGFLPGTLEEKMAPWVRPIYDILYNFITPKEVQTLIEEKIIEISPLGYMRGRTFKNCWIVADEMQNSTVAQMKMLLTRLGENSRLVITGDLEQFDRPGDLNGLEDFLNKFRGRRSSSISSFEFNKEDVQREEVIKEILDIYAVNEIPMMYKTDDISVSTDNSKSEKNESDKNELEIKNNEDELLSKDKI